jgi:hypothetical protein
LKVRLLPSYPSQGSGDRLSIAELEAWRGVGRCSEIGL